jgi:hypothetical protein
MGKSMPQGLKPTHFILIARKTPSFKGGDAEGGERSSPLEFLHMPERLFAEPTR